MADIITSDSINSFVAVFMIIVCAVAFPRVDDRADQAFTIFWGLRWFTYLVVYLLYQFGLDPKPANYWIFQCIDIVGDAFLCIAVYALYKGALARRKAIALTVGRTHIDTNKPNLMQLIDAANPSKLAFSDITNIEIALTRDGGPASAQDDFSIKSKEVMYITTACVILAVLTAVSGLFISSKTNWPSWHVFVMAPSEALACAVNVALGVAAGARFPRYRILIYLICGYYALLQVPAFHAIFIEPVTAAYYGTKYTSSAGFWKVLLAAGKLAFAFCALVILGFNGAALAKLVSNILLIVTVVASAIKIYSNIKYITEYLKPWLSTVGF